MIYLATILILLGLFLFLVASLDIFDFEDLKKSEVPKKNTNPKLQKILNRPVLKKNSKEKDLKIALLRKVEKSPLKKEKESNSEIRFTSPNFDEIPIDLENFTNENFDADNLIQFTDTIPNSIGSLATPNLNKIIQVTTKIMQPIEFKALVYLDYSNKIKDLKLKENPVFPFNLLKELKRIGLIDIKNEEGNYFFQTDFGVLEYKKEDIEKIHFLEEAIFLFPGKKILPTPILFSENLNELKPLLLNSKTT